MTSSEITTDMDFRRGSVLAVAAYSPCIVMHLYEVSFSLGVLETLVYKRFLFSELLMEANTSPNKIRPKIV